MKPKEKTYYVADFETTVYKNQDRTDVWASAIVPLYSEDVKINTSIQGFFDDLRKIGKWAVVYFHNLAFDGCFILDYLLNNGYKYVKDKNKLKSGEFSTAISDMGKFYFIKVCLNQKVVIEFRDSYKLLPFSVKALGENFQTKHRKTEIEYVGFRQPNGVITDKEKEYIANDVLVVKEAIEHFKKSNELKLTIGSGCLDKFKHTFLWDNKYNELFPDLTKIYFEDMTADEYIRKSYRGGWCYNKKGTTEKVYKNGCTIDVNSLYPAMMEFDSGNVFPIGKPTFQKGRITPEVMNDKKKYYFIHIKASFYLKPHKLPFILVRNNLFSDGRYIEDSLKYFDKMHTGIVYNDYENKAENRLLELWLTKTDFELMLYHYNFRTLEFIDFCYFNTSRGVFTDYIDYYFERKINSDNKADRTISKLFLNNLYGKFSSSDNSSSKIPIIDENGLLNFELIEEHDKKAGFIAVGSAVTAYARRYTVTAAQENYSNFLYSDTDSCHMACTPDKLKNIKIHDKDLGAWKIEQEWDLGFFTRQKTYIEVTGDKIEIRACGMNDRCKNNFIDGYKNGKYKLTDFKSGLKIWGRLMPKIIKGGVILEEGYFTIK